MRKAASDFTFSFLLLGCEFQEWVTTENHPSMSWYNPKSPSTTRHFGHCSHVCYDWNTTCDSDQQGSLVIFPTSSDFPK
jgi:hypothetical protein